MTTVHQGKCGQDNSKQMGKTDIVVTLFQLLTVMGAHECDMSSTESHRLSQNVTSHHVLEFKQVLEMLGGTDRFPDPFMSAMHLWED